MVENGDFVAIKQISLHGIPRDVLKSIMVRLLPLTTHLSSPDSARCQHFHSVLLLLLPPPFSSLLSSLFATQSEIDLLKKLHHVNIVKYLGWNQTKEHLFIILEYVVVNMTLSTALHSRVCAVCVPSARACVVRAQPTKTGA